MYDYNTRELKLLLSNNLEGCLMDFIPRALRILTGHIRYSDLEDLERGKRTPASIAASNHFIEKMLNEAEKKMVLDLLQVKS